MTMLKKSILCLIMLVGNLNTLYANTDTKEQQNNEYNSVFWYRDSAEKKALYREIFQLSKAKLLYAKQHDVKPQEHCGVIFDIDETLIDNSAFAREMIEKNVAYSEKNWIQFVKSAVSIATPGAKDITAFIHKMGCTVNLVSGRRADLLAATRNLLNKQGIYYDQILLTPMSQKNTMEKNARFEAIKKGILPSKFKFKQTIIAYYGDNIMDFPNSYQKNYWDKNFDGEIYNKFGTLYFILPNPIYGSWVDNQFV